MMIQGLALAVGLRDFAVDGINLINCEIELKIRLHFPFRARTPYSAGSLLPNEERVHE
jgi:hypothetical protein